MPDTTFTDAREATQAYLLAQRDAHGRWEGELSSSALSTAIAVCAFKTYLADQPTGADRERCATLVHNGLRWLVENQNADGGWGDTVLSFSNISTTALCWAAFAGDDERFTEAVSACERRLAQWVEPDSTTLDPVRLAEAVVRRYGKDHSFSVPILTTLAFTGRLGPAREAWALVPQLPFELAAFPRSWYARLGLPVVSYALPALIAIGQLRHRLAPSWNLPLRWLRDAVTQPTLKVLEQIQPESGGYLEASPLTGFVALSLIGAGRAEHPVARKGLLFLSDSVRPDGSWAIDSNLAIWVTTLSVNAIHTGAAISQAFSTDERTRLREWLVERQYKTRHPFTQAAPGAWAWTDLSGGVPDADDTSGALLALFALDDGGERVRAAAEAGVRWLLDLQNNDGGMPTFCRGWGTLPFDRSSADITAHALRAWAVWGDRLPVELRGRIERAVPRALRYLAATQQADGSWHPLWFGNQHVPEEANPLYGTSRVLLALLALKKSGQLSPADTERAMRGVAWLLAAQQRDGGWGGAADAPSSIEETALAVEALAAADENSSQIAAAIERGLQALHDQTNGGRSFPPSPIGFYFAKLWYFEKLYPAIFAVSAWGRAARVAAIQEKCDDALPRL